MRDADLERLPNALPAGNGFSRTLLFIPIRKIKLSCFEIFQVNNLRNFISPIMDCKFESYVIWGKFSHAVIVNYFCHYNYF